MLLPWLIPLLVFAAVLAIGAAVLAAMASKRMKIQERLKVGKSQASQTGSPFVAKAAPHPEAVKKLGEMVSGKKVSVGLEESMAQAGFTHPAAARIYLGVKIILLAFGLLVSFAVVVPMAMPLSAKIFIVMAISGGLYYMPGMYISYRQSKRAAEVRAFLPDAVDLLEIAVSAGSGLDKAWNSVTNEIRQVSSILADEMALTNMEIHLGASRADAFRHMARRTGSDELSSLVALFVQTERFGTGIADALRIFAASMRETRSINAQERAEKMAVKLLFPMVVFIFPATGLVLVGPALIALMHALSGHPG
jgi:tight adherence protein C